MSNDDKPKLPLFLASRVNTEASRREVLQFLSAFGATLAVPSLASASGGGSWVYIPHGNVIAKALQEPAWRAQLVAHPKQTLAAGGIVLGNNVSVTVVQDSLDRVHVVMSSQEGMRGEEVGVVAEILDHYRTNAQFRNALNNDPRAVFEAWTGATIPDELDVVIVQETPAHRVIHLPLAEAEGLTTPAEVQALWGGDDGWTGGGGDWTVGTIESGQVCNCWSPDSDYESNAPNCCFEEPGETLAPV